MNPKQFWTKENHPIAYGTANAAFKHGLSASRTYHVWQGMKRRCLNKNNPDYPNYGGRGIKICNQWLNAFTTFMADMGKCPTDMSLDRIDTNGDYSPENCRWATQKQQCRNLRKNRRITAYGKTMCVSEWAEHLGVRTGLLWGRIYMGWSPERILTSRKFK